jgi:hypothetical protein
MPPKTLDVMRHSSGASRTASPKGQRLLMMRTTPGPLEAREKLPPIWFFSDTMRSAYCSGVNRPCSPDWSRHACSRQPLAVRPSRSM